MSIHEITQEHPDPSQTSEQTPFVMPERTLNPLWMVTFAAGLLFGMLAVLLTGG